MNNFFCDAHFEFVNNFEQQETRPGNTSSMMMMIVYNFEMDGFCECDAIQKKPEFYDILKAKFTNEKKTKFLFKNVSSIYLHIHFQWKTCSV